jgi:hypothetical protein
LKHKGQTPFTKPIAENKRVIKANKAKKNLIANAQKTNRKRLDFWPLND